MLPITFYKIKDRSMEPSLMDGDYIISNNLLYLVVDPSIGDIVIVKHPIKNKKIIKRVYSKKDKKYFIIGDNIENSDDSRRFGEVDKSSIIGKMIWHISKRK